MAEQELEILKIKAKALDMLKDEFGIKSLEYRSYDTVIDMKIQISIFAYDAIQKALKL